MSRIFLIGIISALTIVMFVCVAESAAQRLEQTRGNQQGSSKIEGGAGTCVATLQAQPDQSAAGDRLDLAGIAEGPLTLAMTGTSCSAGTVFQCCSCFCGCRPNTISPANYCRITCG